MHHDAKHVLHLISEPQNKSLLSKCSQLSNCSRLLVHVRLTEHLSADTYYILSTWSFAAPEVLAYQMTPCDELFEKVSFESQDSWSLGCMLIWLLTGQEPFSLYPDDVAELDLNDSTQLQRAIRKRQLA